MTIEEPVPEHLEWLNEAPIEDKVDWLIDRRLISMRRDRTSGRFYRGLSYIAIVLVFMGLWVTVNNTRNDAKRVAAVEARRITADIGQVQYAQCISTANGRETIKQVLTVLIAQSPNTSNPGTKALLDLVNDPKGPLAPPTCQLPVPVPPGGS